MVKDAVGIASNTESSPPLELYRDFLENVRDQCGKSVEILCTASLGQEGIAHAGRRDELLEYVKATRRSLDVGVLRTLVEGIWEVPMVKSMFVESCVFFDRISDCCYRLTAHSHSGTIASYQVNFNLTA